VVAYLEFDTILDSERMHINYAAAAEGFYQHRINTSINTSLMNLRLPFPTSSRLLVQLVCLLGDVFRVQVLRIRAHNTSHRHKTNVDLLAMQGIQRQHKRALSRLDHRKRCQLRYWLPVELGGARDKQRGQAVFGSLLQQWDGPFRCLVEADVGEL
jgi:hypothetical protein